MEWGTMPRTVLVVDDQALPRQALAGELADAGFAVIEAADGEEAWQRFYESVPDVVVTDLVMPKSDGLELLSRIRERSEVAFPTSCSRTCSKRASRRARPRAARASA
jgi:OmpR family response regulator RpaB